MDYSEILSFAREMRKKPTTAERYIWRKLSGRKFHGRKFNRQFIISYSLYDSHSHYTIVDFHCHSEQLIIEIDGPIHQYKLDEDKEREEILNGMGYKVLRFTNLEVLSNWELVEKKIINSFRNK